MNSKLKLAWRIIVATGLLSITIFVTLLLLNANRLWENMGLKAYYYETSYSENYVIEHKGNYVRTMTHRNGKYLSPKMDQIYDDIKVTDTLTVFWKDGKRGYLDIYTGKVAIPAQFDRAWIFSNGLGAVVKDGKLGFVDRNGDMAIPYQFQYMAGFRDAVDYLFYGGYCTVIGDNLKQGLIDKSGKWVVEPQYDRVNPPVKGCRIVKSSNNYGLFDKELNLILPVECRNIKFVEDGIIVMRDGEQYKLAYDGKTILDTFVVDHVTYPEYSSGENDENGDGIYKQTNYCAYQMYNKFGLMDPKTGRPITKALYDHISGITAELFCCEVAGYRGETGAVIINGRGEKVE